MFKLVLVLSIAAVAIVFHAQPAMAFKIINVNLQQGAHSTSSTPTSTTSTFSPNALVQGVTNSISNKIRLANSLISTLLQFKLSLKSSLLNGITSAASAPPPAASSSSSHSGNPGPAVFTKTVSFGYRQGGASGSTSGGYRH